MTGYLTGRATSSGTAGFAARFPRAAATGFFRTSRGGLTLSSIGMGLYKGAVSDQGDAEWSASIQTGLARGLNVFDTAIRYRAMRSERVLGRTLRAAVAANAVRRDEVFVSSKGGLIAIPEGEDRRSYVERVIVGQRGVSRPLVYDDLHCLDADFLAAELDRSREHLGIETLDCYFVHNPELAFFTGPREAVSQRLTDVFAMLERRVVDGEIAAYGLSSWNGFRRRPGSGFYIDLDAVHAAARSVGGEGHHFRFLELPLSVGMPFACTEPAFGPHGGRTALQRAADLGLDVLTSASLYEGKLDVLLTLDRLMRLAGRGDSDRDAGRAEVTLPVSENSIAQLFAALVGRRSAAASLAQDVLAVGNADLYPSALNIVRSTPGVLTALAGMEHESMAVDNLTLTERRPCDHEALRTFWRSLQPDGEGSAP